MLLFILLLAILDAILGVVVYSFTEDTDKRCFDHSRNRVARGFTGFSGNVISIFTYPYSLPWLQVILLLIILVQISEIRAAMTLAPFLLSFRFSSQLQLVF